MIRITCPCCGVGINAEERLIGQTVRCPKCLSTTKVVRPQTEDLAPVIEPNYEPQSYEEDKPRPTECPKCGKQLPAGEYLCKGCGWHTKIEGYFEDLTEESLARGTEPKTKMERWFDNQLHELATPRDVLIASGLCMAFLGFVAVVAGRILFGPALGTILGLFAAAGIGFGWFMLMQRLGVLKDPKREERLQRERMQRRAKVSRDPGKGRGAHETIAQPVTAIRSSEPATPSRISLPDDEYDADDIDLFAEEPSPSQKTKSQNSASSSPPASPNPKSGSTQDDDWLNDLL